MTGPVVAALALAATVATPVSPRHRLVGDRRPVRRLRLGRPALAAAASVLFAATVAGLVPGAATLAASVLCGTTLLRRRRRIRHRRATAEGAALVSALDVLVGELRIGTHPVRAFDEAAGETGQTTVAAGLRAVAARARLGADVPAGLRSVANSSALPTQWQRLASHWQLGIDHGLPISTLMHTARRDLVERQRFAARVDSEMAGARASVAILAVLPLLGLLLGQAIGAEPMAFLFGRGGTLLVIGALLACVGLLWSDRITGWST